MCFHVCVNRRRWGEGGAFKKSCCFCYGNCCYYYCCRTPHHDISRTSPSGAKCSNSLSADIPFSFAFGNNAPQQNMPVEEKEEMGRMGGMG